MQFIFIFFFPKVILYSLLFDTIIALLVLTVCLIFINRKYYFSDNILITIFFLLTITQSLIIYSLLIPTVVDRSLSIYLLKHLDKNKGSLTMSELTKIAKDDYFKDMNVLETRINEQLATGSIEVVNNEVVLTDKGKNLIYIFSFIKSFLLPRKN